MNRLWRRGSEYWVDEWKGRIWTYLGLYDLEVPHLDTACGKVRNFEFDADGSLAFSSTLCPTHTSPKTPGHTPSVFIVSFDGRQTEFCSHKELLATTKLLDLPNNGWLLRRIVYRPDIGSETRRISVFGYWHKDLDVICCWASLELCSCLGHNSQLVIRTPILLFREAKGKKRPRDTETARELWLKALNYFVTWR